MTLLLRVEAILGGVPRKIGTVPDGQSFQRRPGSTPNAFRPRSLRVGQTSTAPSSAKLTRPASKAASDSADGSSPLCTSIRSASVAHSAQGTMWVAWSSTGSAIPAYTARPDSAAVPCGKHPGKSAEGRAVRPGSRGEGLLPRPETARAVGSTNRGL